MLKTFSLLLFLFFFLSPGAYANTPIPQEYRSSYTVGEVIKVLKSSTLHTVDRISTEEVLQIKLLSGDGQGELIEITHSTNPMFGFGKLKPGSKIVVSKMQDGNKNITYSIFESYRLDRFWLLLISFIALIVFIGGKKGVGAFIGLIISLLIISQWIIPQIVLNGEDPVRIIIIGVIFMLVLTTYIAHGFSLKTTVAVMATSGALLIAGFLSAFLTDAFQLTGLGNEDIYQLQVGYSRAINTQGLLLGAILIGTLGALNDMTTTQSATIFTLVKENPRQKLAELFKKGMVIGREHIASLINTLVLAYAGSGIGIFIFYALNPANLPWWVILNNEATMEEIMATLIGSSALMLAVPFTTILASWVALRGTTYREFSDRVFKINNSVPKTRVKNRK